MNTLIETLTLSPNILLAFSAAFIIQFTIYFCICGSMALIVALMHKGLKIGSILDSRPLKKNQIRNEMRSSLVTCLIYAAYMMVCFRSSSGLSPSSFSEGLFQLLAFLAFYDVVNYFTHRLLHTKRFSHFHRQHHLSVRVTPWSTSSLHPVEAILNQVPFLLFVLVVPVSSMMISLFYVLLMLGMAMSHSNYSPASNLSGPSWLKRYICFHQRHHQMGNINYGFLGTHWDWLCGTHLCEERSVSQS